MSELLNQTLNRRELFKKSLAAIAGIAIAPKLLGTLAQAAGCTDVGADQAIIDDKKYSKLKNLAYLSKWEDFDGKAFKTIKIADKTVLEKYTKAGVKYQGQKKTNPTAKCETCSLYREGKCTMAPGLCVAPGGWCNSYAKKK